MHQIRLFMEEFFNFDFWSFSYLNLRRLTFFSLFKSRVVLPVPKLLPLLPVFKFKSHRLDFFFFKTRVVLFSPPPAGLLLEVICFGCDLLKSRVLETWVGLFKGQQLFKLYFLRKVQRASVTVSQGFIHAENTACSLATPHIGVLN